MNPLQLVGALRSIKGKFSTSLLYVDLTLNGRAMQGIVDTRATHNFINEGTATGLGFKAGEHSILVKVINSQARPVVGRGMDVLIQLGEWQGKTDLLVITIDDFELILAMKFLKTIQAAIVPHLGGLLIKDGKSPLSW